MMLVSLVLLIRPPADILYAISILCIANPTSHYHRGRPTVSDADQPARITARRVGMTSAAEYGSSTHLLGKSIIYTYGQTSEKRRQYNAAWSAI
ncbi:hypothetical protein FKP32DRAFT_1593682, partial [Trametes sanguinea]